MPKFGYDYANLGVLEPFTITSIMGGGMFLLPSPETEGYWKTWGFNPYDAGGDFYSATSDIAVEGVAMRVPEFQVNLPDVVGTKDYGRYLMTSLATVRTAMLNHVEGFTLDNVYDDTYVEMLDQITNQFTNVMRAILTFNDIAAASAGELPPLQPQFGDRYRVEEFTPTPATMEQQVTTSWFVVDMTIPMSDTNGRRIEEFADEQSAQLEVNRLNGNNVAQWITNQIGTFQLPSEAQADSNAGKKLYDHFAISVQLGWGEPITQSMFQAAITELWPDGEATIPPGEGGGDIIDVS